MQIMVINHELLDLGYIKLKSAVDFFLDGVTVGTSSGMQWELTLKIGTISAVLDSLIPRTTDLGSLQSVLVLETEDHGLTFELQWGRDTSSQAFLEQSDARLYFDY